MTKQTSEGSRDDGPAHPRQDPLSSLVKTHQAIKGEQRKEYATSDYRDDNMSATSTTSKAERWKSLQDDCGKKVTLSTRDTLLRTFTAEVQRRQDDKDIASVNPIIEKAEIEMKHPLDASVEEITTQGGRCDASGISYARKELAIIEATLRGPRPTAPAAVDIDGLNAADALTRVNEHTLTQATYMKEKDEWDSATALKEHWLRAYTEALRYEEEVVSRKVAGRASKNSPQILDWMKCDEEHCTWTIAGWGDGNGHWDEGDRKRSAPLPSGTKGAANQYLIKKDPNLGILEDNHNDPRDDGRGDVGRVERYKQAFKDHKDRHHSRTGLRDMIKIEPPTFTMRMDDIKFAEEKEAWKRYLIKCPPSSAIMRLEMMKRSMNQELKEIMMNDINNLNGSMEMDQAEEFLKLIENNAVELITPATHRANLEAIHQHAGEKITPFVNRIKAAASRLALKTEGRCDKKSHPDLTVEDSPKVLDETGTPRAPPIPVWPCAKGEEWERKLDEGRTQKLSKELGGPLIDGHKDQPPCCLKRKDKYMHEWLIKKQFTEKLYDPQMKQMLELQLQAEWKKYAVPGTKFDLLDMNLHDLVEAAKGLEEVLKKPTTEAGGLGLGPNNSRGAPRGGRGGRGNGRGGGAGRGTPPQNQDNVTPANRGGRGGGRGGKRDNPNGPSKKTISKGLVNGKCCGCNQEPHGKKQADGSISNTSEERKQKCPAREKVCDNCGMTGHIQSVCTKPKADAGTRPRRGRAQGGGGDTSQQPQTTQQPPVNYQEWYENYQNIQLGSGGATITSLIDPRKDTYAEVTARRKGDPLPCIPVTAIKTRITMAAGNVTAGSQQLDLSSYDWSDAGDWEDPRRFNESFDRDNQDGSTSSSEEEYIIVKKKHVSRRERREKRESLIERNSHSSQGSSTDWEQDFPRLPPKNERQKQNQSEEWKDTKLYIEPAKKTQKEKGGQNKTGARAHSTPKHARTAAESEECVPAQQTQDNSQQDAQEGKHPPEENNTRGQAKPKVENQTEETQGEYGDRATTQTRHEWNHPPAENPESLIENLENELRTWKEMDNWAYGKKKDSRSKKSELNSVESFCPTISERGNAPLSKKEKKKEWKMLDAHVSGLLWEEAEKTTMMIMGVSEFENMTPTDKWPRRRLKAAEESWIKNIQKTYHKRCNEIYKRQSETWTASFGKGEQTDNLVSKSYIEVGRPNKGKAQKPEEKEKKKKKPKKDHPKTTESRTDVHDCTQTWLSPADKKMQDLYRAKLTSKEAREWLKSRNKCRNPMTQNIHENWVKAPLGFELLLEIQTEHRPCERHMLQGMRGSIVQIQKEQKDILSILKGERQQEKKGAQSATRICSGGTTVTMGTSQTEQQPENEGRKAIRHQHWDVETQEWREGSLPHDWVKVEWCVD